MNQPLVLPTIAIVLCLSVLETRAADETIATAHVSGYGGFSAYAGDLTFQLTLGYGILESSPRIFDQFKFRPDSVVGNVFSVDASSGTGYSAFVANATDGILQHVMVEASVATPPGQPGGRLGSLQSPAEP